MSYVFLLFFVWMTVTLTTDWGDDLYAGMACGALLRALPGASLVTLSHHIAPFQLVEAVHVLRTGYVHFPPGTVHILSVNGEQSVRIPYVALRHDGHFFVGADNGFAGLLTDVAPEEMVCIEKFTDAGSASFAALSVLIPAAAWLAGGGRLSDLGRPYASSVHVRNVLPSMTSASMVGRAVYIDSYRNVVTNITRHDFERAARGRAFEIWVGSAHYRITKISERYGDVPDGELVALFNVSGFMEIAMNKGALADMLSLSLQSTVLVKFYD